MYFDLKVEEQTAQAAMSVRLRTSVENLPRIIGESYGKIAAYLAEMGVQPQFAPYTAYYNMDMQDLDVEMGFPVDKALPDQGDIKVVQIPAGKVVSCMYKGPYSQMEEPYNEIMKWIENNGYILAGVYFEYYFNSPEEVPESELLTKIVLPLK